jgi:hypothetical protein
MGFFFFLLFFFFFKDIGYWRISDFKRILEGILL